MNWLKFFVVVLGATFIFTATLLNHALGWNGDWISAIVLFIIIFIVLSSIVCVLLQQKIEVIRKREAFGTQSEILISNIGNMFEYHLVGISLGVGLSLAFRGFVFNSVVEGLVAGVWICVVVIVYLDMD